MVTPKNPIDDVRESKTDMFELKLVKDEYRLNAVLIPTLRAFGFSLLSFYVLLYECLISGGFSPHRFALFMLVMAAYTTSTWLLLKGFYGKTGTINLGIVILALDIFIILWVIYFSGAENSLLFFVLILRVADQSGTTNKRVMLMAHLTVAGYAVFVCYLAFVEHRPISWMVEGLKILFLYGLNIYGRIPLQTHPLP